MLNPSLRNIHFFCYRKVSVLSIYPHRCKCSTDEHHAAACCCWTNTFSSSCFHKHHVCSQSVKKQSQFNASFLRSRNLATTSVDENATLLWSSRMVPLIGSVWFRQRSRGKFMSVVSLCGHCDASHMPATDSRGFCLLAGRTVAFRLHTQLLWHFRSLRSMAALILSFFDNEQKGKLCVRTERFWSESRLNIKPEDLSFKLHLRATFTSKQNSIFPLSSWAAVYISSAHQRQEPHSWIGNSRHPKVPVGIHTKSSACEQQKISLKVFLISWLRKA